jgi:hypothetical protein
VSWRVAVIPLASVVVPSGTTGLSAIVFGAGAAAGTGATVETGTLTVGWTGAGGTTESLIGAASTTAR